MTARIHDIIRRMKEFWRLYWFIRWINNYLKDETAKNVEWLTENVKTKGTIKNLIIKPD